MAGAHAKVFIWFLLHSNIDGLENNNMLLHLLQKVMGLVLLRIIQKFLGLRSGEQCQFGVFFFGSSNKSSIEFSRVDLLCTLPPVWLELPNLLFNREARNNGVFSDEVLF